MEKRLPIFLLLSFLVFVMWNSFQPRKETNETTTAPTTSVEDVVSEFDPERELVSEASTDTEEREFAISFGTPGEPGSYMARFTNVGARLTSLKLGDYTLLRGLDEQERLDTDQWVELLSAIRSPEGQTGSLSLVGDASAKKLLNEPLEDALWLGRELESGGIEFSYAPGTGVVFKKRILPSPGLHALTLELEIENLNVPEFEGLAQFTLTAAEVVAPIGEERFYQEPQTLAVWRTNNGELEPETEMSKSGERDLTGPLPRPSDSKLAFAGVHNKFFAFLIAPGSDDFARNVLGASYRRIIDEGWLAENPEEDRGDGCKYIVCDLALQLDVPTAGKSKTWSFELYAGPKQRAALDAINPAYTEMVDEDLGWFAGIAKILTTILSFYHGLVGNWGWAIILLTVTVRGLLFPLNRRFQTGMARFAKKMKRVQPLIDASKEKYKDDPKRQREEQSRIMQEEGAFPPLGGCLPMLLQFPVFIGLFQSLRVDFNLRHQPFILWMKDLSLPDQLLRLDLDTHLPFIGTIEYLNILPLLMIGLWITQHKVMPQPESSSADQERMKKMMIGMQVFFAFLFYSYASGLALYMITSSTIAIFETVVIKKVWPIDDTEQEKKKPGRFREKVAKMQKQQIQRMQEEQKRRDKKGKKRK